MRALIVDSFAIFDEMEQLQFIGLQTVSLGASSQKQMLLDEGAIAAETATSSLLVKSVLAVIEQRLLSMCHYTSSLPFAFVLLFSDRPEDVKRSLAWLELVWLAVSEAEVRRRHDQAIASLFGNLPFASWALVRGMLILLAQLSFRCVPSSVGDMVRSIFLGWGTSLPNELGFTTTRMHGKLGMNSRMTPVRRWYHAAVDGPLPQFEREVVEFGGSVRGEQSAAVPVTVFKSTACEESVPSKELDEITGAMDWASFSATSKHAIPAGLSLLLWARSADKWAVVGSAWMALLCQAGDAVRNKSSPDFWLVLHSTQYGFLGVQVECKRLTKASGAKVYCKLRVLGDALPCRWHPVADYTQWLAYPTTASPPIMRLGTSNPQGVLLLLEDHSNPVPLLVRAAKCGVLGMTAFLLDGLARQRGLELERTVIDKVAALVRDAIEGVSEETLREILLLRLPKVGSKPIGTAVPDGILDPSGKKEFTEAATHHEKQVAELQRLSEVLAPGSKCLQARRTVAKRRAGEAKKPATRRPVDLQSSRSVEKARAFLPRVAGCTIQRIPDRRTWIVFDPGVSPASRSRRWGFHQSERKVLRHVLEWARQHHSAKHGAPCPWSFS